MGKILIVYATTDGHTAKICQTIKSEIEQMGDQVTLVSVDQTPLDELNSFDKIIIGASIRYGKHSLQVTEFVRKNKTILDATSSAFFTVNAVARKADKNTPETNPYLNKFLHSVNWIPDEVAVFAGKIDYKKYGFIDRQMIRFIMYITKGPTDLQQVVEFTNWQQVKVFADKIIKM